MVIRECQVSFIDQRGIRHSVAVYAGSVLEAAAAGLKQIRETEMIGEEGRRGSDGGYQDYYFAQGSVVQVESVA